MSSLLIIIPAYNEAAMIGKVIDSIPEKIKYISKKEILVIDDGSSDDTYKIAKSKNVKVLRHLINRGLGAVLSTGFTYAKNQNYDFVVTFDADGQHDARDISSIIKTLYDGQADVVIGSRMLNLQTMPMVRVLVNYLSNIMTYLLFNIWVTDSQSGLRGFTRDALEKLNIRTQRMEVSSEIFKEISKKHLKLSEISILPIYTNYSLHKGQKITNAPNVFWKLLLNKFS